MPDTHPTGTTPLPPPEVGPARLSEPSTAVPEDPRRFPVIAGRCPACRGSTLFLGAGGHVTCARSDCPDPGVADDMLHAGGAWHVTACAHEPLTEDQADALFDAVNEAACAVDEQWDGPDVHVSGGPCTCLDDPVPPAAGPDGAPVLGRGWLDRHGHYWPHDPDDPYVDNLATLTPVLLVALDGPMPAAGSPGEGPAVPVAQEQYEAVREHANQQIRVAGWAKPAATEDLIPRYAQLDVWLALGGDPVVFERWRDARTYAAAWAQLMVAVRRDIRTLHEDRNPPAGEIVDLLLSSPAPAPEEGAGSRLAVEVEPAPEPEDSYSLTDGARLPTGPVPEPEEGAEPAARRFAEAASAPLKSAVADLRHRIRARQADQPCPTCTGQSRETVGMVCQTCGTDYGPPPEPGPEPAGDGPGWDREIIGDIAQGLSELPDPEAAQVRALLADRDQLAEQLPREAADRDRLSGELTTACAEARTIAHTLKLAAGERDAARAELAEVSGERDAAIEREQQRAAERAQYRGERDAARAELAKVIEERNLSGAERRAAARSARDSAGFADQARTELDLVTAQRDALAAEAAGLREHSVTLNSVGWKLATALGDVPEGAERIEGNTLVDVDRLVAWVERLRAEYIEQAGRADTAEIALADAKGRLADGNRSAHNLGDMRAQLAAAGRHAAADALQWAGELDDVGDLIDRESLREWAAEFRSGDRTIHAIAEPRETPADGEG